MKRNTAAPLILGGLAAAALAYVYLRNKARAGGNNGSRAVNGIFGYVAEYENPVTGGKMTRYFNNKTEAAATIAAQKAKTKNQILVSVTKQKTYKSPRRITDEAKQKMIFDLRDYFGGKKYNEISDGVILRIADHSKNPTNDGKYNYDKKVISFVLPSYGGKFSGYNANEYDISELSFSEALRFIKSKIYK